MRVIYIFGVQYLLILQKNFENTPLITLEITITLECTHTGITYQLVRNYFTMQFTCNEFTTNDTRSRT